MASSSSKPDLLPGPVLVGVKDGDSLRRCAMNYDTVLILIAPGSSFPGLSGVSSTTDEVEFMDFFYLQKKTGILL